MEIINGRIIVYGVDDGGEVYLLDGVRNIRNESLR